MRSVPSRPIRSARTRSLSTREQLRDVDDAVLGEIAFAPGYQHVARCPGAAQVGGQGARHDGRQPAAVEQVVLDHDKRPAQPRPRAGRLAQIHPVQVALTNHQSPMRRFIHDFAHTDRHPAVERPPLRRTQRLQGRRLVLVGEVGIGLVQIPQERLVLLPGQVLLQRPRVQAAARRPRPARHLIGTLRQHPFHRNRNLYLRHVRTTFWLYHDSDNKYDRTRPRGQVHRACQRQPTWAARSRSARTR